MRKIVFKIFLCTIAAAMLGLLSACAKPETGTEDSVDTTTEIVDAIDINDILDDSSFPYTEYSSGAGQAVSAITSGNAAAATSSEKTVASNASIANSASSTSAVSTGGTSSATATVSEDKGWGSWVPLE